MKITEQTTLGQLAMRRMELGVVLITITSDGGKIGTRVAVLETLHGVFYGAGLTEAEALDQAFVRLENHIGATILREQRNGVVPPPIEIVKVKP